MLALHTERQTMTKQILFTAALTLAAATLNAQTPPPPAGPAAEARTSYMNLKGNILKAADKMPEADFQYRPTPEIRTYAKIINHITMAQMRTCNALNGTTFDPKSMPSDTADKATILAGLKASFDVCDRAYGALTDGQLIDVVTVGPASRSRIGAAWGNVSHDNEQYAELSTYLRLKGLVPPTAEK